MLIQSYIAPRMIDAFGSLSEAYVSFQGILAGCSAASSVMMAILLQPIKRTIGRFPGVQARALMDDVSLQWQGPDVDEASQVLGATKELCRQVLPIGLLLQPNKSGFVSLSTAAERKLKVTARMIGFASRKHMRNLGHDMYGRRIYRRIETARRDAMWEKRQRIAALRRAAGHQDRKSVV